MLSFNDSINIKTIGRDDFIDQTVFMSMTKKDGLWGLDRL